MNSVVKKVSVASLVTILLVGSGIWFLRASENGTITSNTPTSPNSQIEKTPNTLLPKLPIITTLISKDDARLKSFLVGSTPKIISLSVSIALVLVGVGVAVAVSTVLISSRQSQDYGEEFSDVRDRIADSVEKQLQVSGVKEGGGGGEQGLAPGAIAGITVASIVGFIILVVVGFFGGIYCYCCCYNELLGT